MIPARKNNTATKYTDWQERHGCTQHSSSTLSEHALRKAVIYTRVSSKEQERDGFSIPAQRRYLRSYAERKGFEIMKEFEDVESAKCTGRKDFTNMIRYLRKHPYYVILVEKTDRLMRNLTDGAILTEKLNVEIHRVKEGEIKPRNASAEENYRFVNRIAESKRFIDNLSEEVIKGKCEKARQGGWPTRLPRGYKKFYKQDGSNEIVVDPEDAPIIHKIFECYASGEYSLKEIAKMARGDGLKYRKSGKPVRTSAVYSMLKNRFYCGLIEWNSEFGEGKEIYPGKHPPIVSVDLWNRVQSVLEGRNSKKHRRAKHDFAYSGLIACAKCGCAVTGVIKKKKYIYYLPTAYDGKCLGDRKSCQKHVPERELERQILEMLERLELDPVVLEWAVRVHQTRQSNSIEECVKAIAHHRKRHEKLEKRLDTLLTMRCDDQIGDAEYNARAEEWQKEKADCALDIEHQENALQSHKEESARLINLGGKFAVLFKSLSPQQKRQVLHTLFDSIEWQDGSLTGTFRPYFKCFSKSQPADQSPTTRMGYESGSSVSGPVSLPHSMTSRNFAEFASYHQKINLERDRQEDYDNS